MVYNISCFRGYGSVGRAVRSQRTGHEFESRYLHQWKPKSNNFVRFRFFVFQKTFYKKRILGFVVEYIIMRETLITILGEKENGSHNKNYKE